MVFATLGFATLVGLDVLILGQEQKVPLTLQQWLLHGYLALHAYRPAGMEGIPIIGKAGAVQRGHKKYVLIVLRGATETALEPHFPLPSL